MGVDKIQSAAATMIHRRQAFTIVELVLALAIAGLVSASAAGMLMAVSYGTSSKRDLRSAVVKSQVVDNRIASAIRGSRAILETGIDYLVLWTGDTDANGAANAPDLAEMRLIERDSATHTLKAYQFPDSWTQVQIDAANITYALTGNPGGFFLTVTTAAKTAGSFQPTLWGSGVTSISFVLDDPDPSLTRLASYRLVIASGDLSETVVGSASVRYTAVN